LFEVRELEESVEESEEYKGGFPSLWFVHVSYACPTGCTMMKLRLWWEDRDKGYEEC